LELGKIWGPGRGTFSKSPETLKKSLLQPQIFLSPKDLEKFRARKVKSSYLGFGMGREMIKITFNFDFSFVIFIIC